MEDDNDHQTPPQTPPGLPILEDSVWSDPGGSWNDFSVDGRSGEATADVDGFLPPRSRQWEPMLEIMESWIRLRWRLSRRLFSVSIPFFTAELEVKLGDFVITFPVIVALFVVSSIQVANGDVKGSGIPPSIALAFVFAFAVRNNSLLVTFAGISFERALFYHKLFAFVMVILAAMHALGYILTRTDATAEHNHKVVTGMIAFIAMAVLYLFSLGWIRRRFHELFVRMHWLLFIVILITAVLHGGLIALAGVLPWEIDMVFRLVYRTRVYSHGTLFSSKPQSTSDDLYVDESGQDLGKVKNQRLGVAARDQVKVFQLPGDITCIQFPRVRQDTGEEFKYKAGQYAFLCIPSLAALEWHPFSISSSPHEHFITFHIKAVGDWTMKLLHAAPESREECEFPFDVLIDGPYGSLSIDIEDATTYSHFVLFAGGMGMTPMRSVLNWLHNECYFQKARVIHRLRFIWAVGNSESLQALLDLEADPWINNSRAPYLPDVLLCPTTLNVSTETLSTEIYLTRGLVGSRAELDSQLTKCLWYHCRPDIEQTLREMGREAVKSGKLRVAVLVCGPKSMAPDVVVSSLRLSREMNVQFDVHSEHFSF
ncbi:hypothetical protein PHYSODRAFT_306269 [Phytophthora sojae]|uniref:FAD-binding FR-type domain-containing protein n=1 Tax=Phytophthora sojae (strain P6497) TaxID=1094619 RepID=G5A8R4_PHYSP|nr:hypothetical protein PHYSODRAFT_306269 [Phytophthora sojae]EGZ08290.1 hypothetical protein PHYSODRAFT_306269 [Phytophthora sojae]|eukprot:XP_009536462.1 hypothetical protein PHYSODRAFT_306269 [Phytophthora sojae]